MPKFLIQATYTAEGLRLLQKDRAAGRRQVVASALEPLGGRIESLYFAFGEYDIVSLVEMPDHLSVTAMAIAACASGLVRTKTTPLLCLEETDQALQKSASFRLTAQ